jgi:hypothetical protein
MLRQAAKLGVRPCPRKDRGILFGDCTPALALKCTDNDRCATPSAAGGDGGVDELNEVVWKANGDLLAHPKMVANRYHDP